MITLLFLKVLYGMLVRYHQALWHHTNIYVKCVWNFFPGNIFCFNWFLRTMWYASKVNSSSFLRLLEGLCNLEHFIIITASFSIVPPPIMDWNTILKYRVEPHSWWKLTPCFYFFFFLLLLQVFEDIWILSIVSHYSLYLRIIITLANVILMSTSSKVLQKNYNMWRFLKKNSKK